MSINIFKEYLKVSTRLKELLKQNMDIHQFLNNLLGTKKSLSVRNNLSDEIFHYMDNTGFEIVDRAFSINTANYLCRSLIVDTYGRDPMFEQRFNIRTEFLFGFVASSKKEEPTKYSIWLELKNELSSDKPGEFCAEKRGLIKKVRLPEKEFFLKVKTHPSGEVDLIRSIVNPSFREFWNYTMVKDVENKLFTASSVEKLRTVLHTFLSAIPDKLAP